MRRMRLFLYIYYLHIYIAAIYIKLKLTKSKRYTAMRYIKSSRQLSIRLRSIALTCHEIIRSPIDKKFAFLCLHRYHVTGDRRFFIFGRYYFNRYMQQVLYDHGFCKILQKRTPWSSASRKPIPLPSGGVRSRHGISLLTTMIAFTELESSILKLIYST